VGKGGGGENTLRGCSFSAEVYRHETLSHYWERVARIRAG
jgi:hypothetical protein